MSSIAELRAEKLAQLPLEDLGPAKGLFKGTVGAIKDVVAHRELLGLLVRRELRSRYKDSTLGFAWSLLKPIFQLAVYYLVMGQFLGAARGIDYFAVYIFCGLTIWGLFSECVNGGTLSIIANAGLVKKTYLPREVFPLAATGSALFNFCVQLIVLFGGTVIFGVFPTGWRLLYIPAAALLTTVLGTALGMLLGALNVYLRDVQHIVDIVLLLMFWASPIVYSLAYVHKEFAGGFLETLYLCNPVTLAVLAMQKGAWAGTGENVYWPTHLDERVLIAIGLSFILLWVAQRVFDRLAGNFAQEL